MTTEEAAAALQERMRNADADELIAALASMSPARPGLIENNRRQLIRLLAVRLSIRVMSPGYIEEGDAK